MEKVCRTCRFFENNNCKKGSPIILEMKDGSIITKFPEVTENDWCGNWTKIPVKLDRIIETLKGEK